MKSSQGLVRHGVNNRAGGSTLFLFHRLSFSGTHEAGSPAMASASILTQAYTAVVCIAVRSLTAFPLVCRRRKKLIIAIPERSFFQVIPPFKNTLKYTYIFNSAPFYRKAVLKSPRSVMTAFIPVHALTARSSAIISATAPSILSVDFSLSGLMFPAGSVLT